MRRAKKALLDSDSDDEPVVKSTKKKNSLDSDSDEEAPKKLEDATKDEAIKQQNTESAINRSRSRSSSVDSRISIDSRRSISSLEDSRLRRSISPLEDSRIRRSVSPLEDSRLDDSRISRRSSFDDSRLRSPISSPISSRRSLSRSLSPLSPTPGSPYTLAKTPHMIKTRNSKTPATKRGRTSPQSSIKSAKKSRVKSPQDKSLKLLLSETMEPSSQESLKLQLSETLETAVESPIKKVGKKKAAIVDSDSD